MKLPHISVCICTYKRPVFLNRLLEKLTQQNTEGAFTYSITVADNDATRSAEDGVLNFAQRTSIKTTYCCEPRQNIALVRNLAIASSDGDFIAFIDDDEFPTPNWLAQLLATCDLQRASGVLGPVKPHFESPPPSWILRGRFCDRTEYATGTILDAGKTRTGNVLFRREILKEGSPPFLQEFGTGGEDVDFFRRLIAGGCIFVWCNEAVVFETVPPSRWTRRYMLSRALLRGTINLKNRSHRFKLLAISAVAVPLYSLMLPFTLLFGQHVFMKYCIKYCDHLGRLLAFVGLNPVSERSM